MPGKTNVALIGWGRPIYNFYKILKKNTNIKKIIIITHYKKNHLEDKKYFNNNKIFYDIFKLKKNLDIFETDLINQKSYNILKENKINLIISAGSKFIFPTLLINKYYNNIFNFHPSYLPEEKGGANFTYRILMKKNYVAATVHEINKKIDDGNIVFQIKKKNLSMNLNTMFVETYKLYDILLKKLLLDYFNKKLKSKKQNKYTSSYFYKVSSYKNGKINLNWGGKDIEIFIKAFSRPYKGAFLIEKNTKKKIYIIISQFKNSNKTHPFLNGKVYKIYRNGDCDIFCNNGYLRIKQVSLNKKILRPDKILKHSSTLI